MNKILILGISGFSGSHFINYIHRNRLFAEHRFWGLSRSPANRVDTSHISYIQADLSQKSAVKSVLRDLEPDYIINLVGQLKAESFESFMAKNFDLSRYIFESLIELGLTVKNILLIGSAAEYGRTETLPITEDSAAHPVSHYGLTKYFQTLLARFYFENHGISSNVARTFNLMGDGLSGELAYGAFVERINAAGNGDTIAVGNLNSERDYISIEAAIDAYWKILLYGKAGEVYNVCTGIPVKIETLLHDLIEKSQKKIKIKINDTLLQQGEVDVNYGSPAKLVALLNRIECRTPRETD